MNLTERLDDRIHARIMSALECVGLLCEPACDTFKPTDAHDRRAPGSATKFARQLTTELVAIIERVFADNLASTHPDTELLKAAGYNAGLYREAIAVALRYVQREAAPATPALSDRTAIVESLKAAAFDYGSGSDAGPALVNRLKRAALVFAADELETADPAIDVAAICKLYRLALELSK